MRSSGLSRTGPLDTVAYAGIFVFGIVMALLGAVMPVLLERLSLGLADVGTVFLVTNGAMLAASLLVGPTMDRFGMKPPLAAGAALVACALVAMAQASSLGALLIAGGVLGFGGGALNAGANTLVADLHDDPDAKAAALNALGVFFGLGALLLPVSVGALLSHAGLPVLLTATAALCAAAAVISLAPVFPAPKQAHGLPLADMRRLARVPLVLTLAFLLFFQSGNEFVIGGYLSTFVTERLQGSIAAASYLLAGLWAAIIISRVLLSRIVLLVGAHTVIVGGAMLAGFGVLVIGAAQNIPVVTGGVLLTGLAMAGIFPTVLGLAGAAFPAHSGTVFGILFTLALTGGMTMPWAAGQLAEVSGLRAVFVLAAGNFLAVAALATLSRRIN
jgi:MFS transporter, FHS family, glucose/mannose:H+ symporter